MSERPRTERAAIVALGLAILLLADPLTSWRGHGVAAASEPGAVIEEVLLPVEPPGDEDADACVSGFGDTDSKVGIVLHGVALTSRGALAVGFSRVGESDDLGHRHPAAV